MDEADLRAKLEPFQALIGEWTIEMTHLLVEGTVVRGRATYEWLEGDRFLIQRAVNEHPDFPDSLCLIGVMEGENDLWMQYFDSRGVHRVYTIGFDGRELTLGRDVPGFAQHGSAKLSDDGSTLAGVWQLKGERPRWRRAPPVKTESPARDGAIDTTLIPPGTQYSATCGNPEKGNPFRYGGIANPCTPLQLLNHHS
jgi:hypothetical protein